MKPKQKPMRSLDAIDADLARQRQAIATLRASIEPQAARTEALERELAEHAVRVDDGDPQAAGRVTDLERQLDVALRTQRQILLKVEAREDTMATLEHERATVEARARERETQRLVRLAEKQMAEAEAAATAVVTSVTQLQTTCAALRNVSGVQRDAAGALAIGIAIALSEAFPAFRNIVPPLYPDRNAGLGALRSQVVRFTAPAERATAVADDDTLPATGTED